MKNILLISLLFLFPIISFSQITLTIEIEELRNSKGKLQLEFNDENKEVIKQMSVDISDNKSIVIIEDLKPGKYAFKFFHDENNDEKINTNLIGMPKEGFGFSNNAKGTFGPPAFNKTIFTLTESKTVKCTVMYLSKK